MNKKIIWGISVLIVIILLYQFFIIVIMSNKVDDLKNTIDANYSEIADSINDINGSLQNTLYEELSKSHFTKQVEFKVDKVEKDKYILDVAVDLSKSSNDSKVYFMYKENDSDKWNEVILSENGNLSYTGKMEYKIDSKYKYKVVTKGSISESGDITDLDKYEFIPYPPEVNYGEELDVEGKKLSIYANLNGMYTDDDGNYHESNKKDGSDQDIKSVDIIFGIDGKEKVYKCEYYEENQNDIEGTEWREKGYKALIPKKDYEGKLNYIKMKVTYKNGVTDIKDITSDIEVEYIN